MRLPLALVVLLAGCTAAPAPAADDASVLFEEEPIPTGPWVEMRTFAFDVTNGVAVPGSGTSRTSYDGLAYDCAMFTLPKGLTRLTLWVNSTPDDPLAASVGGVTADLRHGGAPLGGTRYDAVAAGVRSYILVIDAPPEGDWLANFKAESVTLNGHAQGTYILEGNERDIDGNPRAALSRCL